MSEEDRAKGPMTHEQMLQLKRWNTPTIYNGWEQITSRDAGRECFNVEETRDFMPQMGPMVGRAVTIVVEPSNPKHREANPDAWREYRRYVASEPGPKIVVGQDMDKPAVHGSLFGEVLANFHRVAGCVGLIMDGAARDIDEMTNAGFKVLARRLCVGHAHVWPVRWGCEVEVFGRRIVPGQLIHADKHGFLAVPPEDEAGLLEAAVFMDANECNTVIKASRGAAGLTTEDILSCMDEAGAAFQKAVSGRFRTKGEW